jgi:hypothetical protein
LYALKLTPEKVRAIRRLGAKYGSKRLAELFGVTRATVNRVLNGGIWKEVA